MFFVSYQHSYRVNTSSIACPIIDRYNVQLFNGPPIFHKSIPKFLIIYAANLQLFFYIISDAIEFTETN